jgi:CRP-like cAMP-binding protein
MIEPTDTIDPNIVKHINYFVGCGTRELNYIRKYLTYKSVPKGEVFMIEGHWCDFLYFVISGVVKIYKTSYDGRQQILHIARFGDSLNDVSTFDKSPNAASMIALTPVVLYGLRKTDLDTILFKYPKVAENACRVLAGRIRRDSDLIEVISLHQVVNRIANALLKYFGEQIEFDLRFTQQDIADMVGTSREMVNKSLKEMEERKAIKMDRQGIVILDKEILEEIAKYYPLMRKRA